MISLYPGGSGFLESLSRWLSKLKRERTLMSLVQCTVRLVSIRISLEAVGLKVAPVNFVPVYQWWPSETGNVIFAVIVVTVRSKARVSVCADISIEINCFV
jgi:hypothetical protein